MSWSSWLSGRLPRHKLHAARFRRLVESVRLLVELHDDASDKLAGQWVIDRRYVASVGQRAMELARRLVFDSGVLAGEDPRDLYAVLDNVRAGLDAVLARRGANGRSAPRIVPLRQAAETRTAPICESVRLLAEVARQLEVPVPEGFVVAGLGEEVPEATQQAIAKASAKLASSGAGGVFSLYPARSRSGEAACPEEWGQAMHGIPAHGVAEACERLLARVLEPSLRSGPALSENHPRAGGLCVSCISEPEARARGLLLTSDPDRPLRLRLDVLSGSSRTTYVAERHPLEQDTAVKPEPAGAIPRDYDPLVRHALAIERFAGRPQALAWTRGDAGFAVLQCADLVLPSAVGPSGPRLAEALRRHEQLFRDPGSVAVAGFAAGSVCRLPSEAPPWCVGRPTVLVLPRDQDSLPVSSLREAAAVLTEGARSEQPWLWAARELRIPVLTGLGDAAHRLREGETVTIDAQEGIVYRGIARELALYHLVEPTCYQTEPEYRLLRSAIDWVAPPSSPSAPWPAATSDDKVPRLCEVLRIAHERALGGFERLRYGGWGRRSGILVAGSGFPGFLRIVDAGGGTSPADEREWFPKPTFDRVRSEPLRALLAPFAAACGARPQRQGMTPTALAVLTQERAVVDIEWTEGTILVEACLGGHAPTNSVYCAFRSPLRVDPPEALGRAARESGFRLLDLGTGLTGWVVGRPYDESRQTLGRLGRALLEVLTPSGAETGTGRPHGVES